jgi:hypothetical protein
MKTFVKIFLLIVMLVVLASAVFATPAAPLKKYKDTVNVSVTPTHYRNLLILTAAKSYRGASIEVHDTTGIVVASSQVHKDH